MLTNDENFESRKVLPQELCGIQAIHSGHTDIEQDKVWPQLINFLKSFIGIRRFSADLQIRIARKQLSYSAPYQAAVIRNKNSHAQTDLENGCLQRLRLGVVL